MSKLTEKDIFLNALELQPGSERQQFVKQACAEDNDLYLAVTSLLKNHDSISDEAETDFPGAASLHNHFQRAALALGLSATDFSAPPEFGHDRSGEVIQNYRLMEKLGEGGFGQVYVARQSVPVRRDVAIKLLKPGMDTKDILARFEAEQQALALMNHTNIAQIFDVGCTDAGLPYIVMELVRGIPITKYCQKKMLSVRERLDLFRQVCLAVHHAHQKGVIHRDLKPSNVLLATHETGPVVKVIDFGVAKALDSPLTEKTIYTRFAQLIGTPMYMSPEQAELNAIDVDTRSDIYSLGVLLYELLTDCTPLSSAKLETATFDEMRRLIREETPLRPSVKVSTVIDAQATKNGNSDAMSLQLKHELRGDLDWIVMKALEKERSRRYDSAADFARDIDSFLNQLPVIARPPSNWYRLSKMAQRNKLPLLATALILLTMILGTAISAWQAVKANRSRAEAEKARQETIEFAQRLRDANILLVSARANSDQGRYQQAYREYTEATQLSPDHFLTWAGRGSLLKRIGAFEAAADDYETAIELGSIGSDPSWWDIPHLLVITEREAAYEKVCQSFLSHENVINDQAAFLAQVRGLCLKPLDPETVKKLQGLMRTFENRNELESFFRDEELAPPPNDRPPKQSPGSGQPPRPRRGMPRELLDYTSGLILFRSGEYAQTIKKLEPLCRAGRRGTPMARILAQPVLALCYHRSGQQQASSAMLEAAAKSDQEWAKTLGTFQIDDRLRTMDGLEAHVFLHEATLEITGSPMDEIKIHDNWLDLNTTR